MKITWFDRKI